MKIKSKKDGKEYIILGIRPRQYLIFKDEWGLAVWSVKDKFEKLKSEPEYLKKDSNFPSSKVVEIFKLKYDLDFYVGEIDEYMNDSTLFFGVKRTRLALSSIGMSNLINSEYDSFRDEHYFSILTGKFETIDGITNSQLLGKKAHSVFEWSKGEIKFENLNWQLSDIDVEKGVINLCEFVSSKVLPQQNNKFLFTDLYTSWKTFLLGNEFMNYGEIKMEDELEIRFICTFEKGKTFYRFDYQFCKQ